VVDMEASVAVYRRGERRRTFVICRDISSSKKAERRLKLGLAREKAAREELHRVNEMKNTLLAAVSHDLRSPLAAIRGMAETLLGEHGQLTEEQTQDVTRRILTRTHRLERTLANLLDLDRLFLNRAEPDRRPTDLRELIDQVIKETDLGDHRLEVVAPHECAEVDPVQVERIMENLLSNAAIHTPPGSDIHVRVTLGPRGVTLVVDDSGPGIPEQARQAIDTFPAGSVDGGHGSSGVGLYLVGRFAEQHGGGVSIVNRPGGGASVEVFLPIARPQSPSGLPRTR
jgi:two-component system sensor histidine kinase KdpD